MKAAPAGTPNILLFKTFEIDLVVGSVWQVLNTPFTLGSRTHDDSLEGGPGAAFNQ